MKQKETTIKILIVEDLPTDVELAVREIRKGNIDFTYKVVDTEPEFKKELSAFNPDIIVSDYMMPGFDGMKALKITRAKDSIIPFVVLTGSMNEETAVDCMKAGANDYVLKEKIKRLPFAIHEALEKSQVRKENEKIEKQLSESEEKYRSLIENSADAIYLLFNRKFEIINPSFEKMFGYSIDEVNRSDFDFTQLVAPESKPYIEERFKKMQQGKYVDPRYEFTAITKNGEKKEVEASVSYIDFKGEKAVQGVIRDITEKKKMIKDLIIAKERAEESEFKVRSMFKNSQIGILFCDNKGNILEVNPAILDILGSPSIEATKKINLLTFKPLQEVGFAQNIEKCITEKRLITEVTQYKSKWGKTVFMRYYLFPVIVNEKVIGVWANLNNLTDLYTTQNELIAAKEKAEESDRLKSAFLANVSHEIRTPMNGILGFADLLKKPELNDEKQQSYIDIIEKSGNRMLDLIDDLINISRIESGEVDISFTETNLNVQFNFLYDFFHAETEQKGLDLKLNCPLPLDQAKIYTDREKFEAIMINLVKNAIKFTNEGKIEMGYEPKKGKIEFYVKDSGVGVPKDKQEAIFKRFVQAESGFSRDYEGAGLGLSITKAYVEALGGKIWLKSEEGKGTQIYFTLPVNAISSQSNKPETKEKKEKKAGPKDAFNNLTVLAAEDDEFNYLLIEELLLDQGINVIRAKNGQEAIDICKKNDKINMILMDIKMPVVDGYEAAKIIKKFNPEMLIIAQSAYAMEHEIKKFSTIFDDYITKPIKADELNLKMKKWLTKE